MDFYESKESVEKYIKFIPNDDGAVLVDTLVKFLPADATVLELGIGPGKDFNRLSKHFSVTGSDASREFLRVFRQRNKQADLLHLDARTLKTERTFDCIFSNKVLIHMPRHELEKSLVRQHDVLNDAGLILHSFWHGSGDNEYSGLKLFYHTEQDIADLLDESYDILEIGRHTKMTDNDSVYVLARKKNR